MGNRRVSRVGIIANSSKDGAGEVLGRLLEALRGRGIQWVLTDEAAMLAGLADEAVAADQLGDQDLVVVLGGDGTLLQAVRALGDAPPPVVGINTGALGFLTAATGDMVGELAEALANGNYRIENRSLVVATVHRVGGQVESLTGLNEVVVSRGAISRIINLEAWVSGVLLNRFHGDGLIVATPTGSTAYSLSAGGPLMSPRAKVLVVTPVCPHALANRSFVVDDEEVIEIKRETEAEEVVLSVDGQQMVEIGAGDVVEVRKAGYPLPLVQTDERGIYGVLQRKLGWHGSHV